MVRPTRKTVFDYLDLIMEYDRLSGDTTKFVGLNKYEWAIFNAVLDNNPKELEAHVIKTGTPNQVLYKGLLILYDGSENTSDEYLHSIEYLTEEINRLANPRTQETNRPRRRRNTGRIAGDAIPVEDNPRQLRRFQVPTNEWAVPAGWITPNNTAG